MAFARLHRTMGSLRGVWGLRPQLGVSPLLRPKLGDYGYTLQVPNLQVPNLRIWLYFLIKARTSVGMSTV